MESLNLKTALTIVEQSITTATPADCPSLVGELARLQAVAWARMMQTPSPSPATALVQQNGNYLTVEEVGERFNVTARWLYRHKKQMPHSQPSRKILLFPEGAITKWFASRKVI